MLDSAKWHIFWRFGPYWVQKYPFRQNQWKIRRWWDILPRHLPNLLILHTRIEKITIISLNHSKILLFYSQYSTHYRIVKFTINYSKIIVSRYFKKNLKNIFSWYFRIFNLIFWLFFIFPNVKCYLKTLFDFSDRGFDLMTIR